MKKILFIITLMFVIFIGINVNALDLEIGTTNQINFCRDTNNYSCYDYEKYAYFTAPTTDWYEFEITNPNNDNYLYLYNSYGEDLDSSGYDNSTNKVIVYGYLSKGQTYKLEINDYEEYTRIINMAVRKHTHNFKVNYVYSPYYDYDPFGEVDYECGCGQPKSGKISASLRPSNFEYNGKVKTPSVVITNTAGIKLYNNKQYKVSYQSGRKKVGSYKVTITFIDSYHKLNKMTKTFTIGPKNTSKLKLTASNGSLKVKWKKQSKQTNGYELRYSKNKNMTSSKTIKIKSNKKTSYKINKLKSKKKYYVQIRTYKKQSGKKYYSNWSNIKYKKVK